MKNPKACIDLSQKIDHVYEHLEDYNTRKKGRVLIVFDDVIADTESNKKINPNVTELFLRVRKVNIPLVFYNKLISK